MENRRLVNLQGSCTADSPFWCGHLSHTGSSSASPVHLSSSAVHSCVWPDPCLRPVTPLCHAGAQAFSPCPFCALTWVKITHNILPTCSFIQSPASKATTSYTDYDHTYFLRMGQSFMKWPILPQMRQQRSLGATSPSVRTSGSKKYSYNRSVLMSPYCVNMTFI